MAVTAHSTTSASMPASHYPSGARTDGYTQTIRAAGFNGIADTIWAAECRKKIFDSPNQHQHAFAVVFHPSLQEYTVGPHIQVSSRRQIPLLPMPVLALPLCRQTGNHRRRQVRCVLAQQRGQCLLEVHGRDATQIKHRQQRIQALRAPCPQRQNRRGEPDPLAVAGSPAIPNLHPGNLDSTDPRLDRAFGTMTVPDNTVSSISKPETLHLGKKCLGFQLDSLRQQLSRTRSQDIGQGIIDLVGVTKTNNIAILIHGVSLSLRGSGRLDTRLDTPPISLRHHPGSCLAHRRKPGPLKDFPFGSGRGPLPVPEAPNKVYRIMSMDEAAQALKARKLPPHLPGKEPYRYVSLD